MSSTNRSAKRAENDFYPTPVTAIDVVMAEMKPEAFEMHSWLEPCAGDFRIYNRMPEGRREWAELTTGRDYLANTYRADICLTNPPFSAARRFAEKALSECGTVIFLQRINWLESNERKRFWQEFPPSHLFVLASRPKFVAICKGDKKRSIKGCGEIYSIGARGTCSCGGTIGDGSDSTAYGWFAWDRLGILKRPPGIYVI